VEKFNTNELPVYNITDIKPIEDQDGNLIDFECELKPDNIIAEVIDASDSDLDFKDSDKIIQVTDTVAGKVKHYKELYGDKNCIEYDTLDE
jgi:hypothetical protein